MRGERSHFDLKHRYGGVPMDGGKTLRQRQRGCSDRPGTCTWTTTRHTSPSRALGTKAWGNPFPSPLLPWTRCSQAAASSSQDRYTAASCALPASGLNQGWTCNSGVLQTTERTPHHLTSPIGPNWVATGNAAWRYVHFTLALV